MKLELGLKTDPIETRYSFPWVFDLIAEEGIPDRHSRATRLGIYNLDPAVRFWATPPIHRCLRTTVVHPAAFTFKSPDNVSFAEGAMVEPSPSECTGANKVLPFKPEGFSFG